MITIQIILIGVFLVWIYHLILLRKDSKENLEMRRKEHEKYNNFHKVRLETEKLDNERKKLEIKLKRKKVHSIIGVNEKQFKKIMTILNDRFE